MKNTYLAIIMLLSVLSLYAQDPQYSQFYSNPLYNNHALAGSAHHYRLISHSRLQWPGLDARNTSTLFSFDKYFNHYKSGFGAYFINDNIGGGKIVHKELALMYSYELHLTDNYTFRFGLQASYNQKNLGQDFIFPDQVNARGLTGQASQEAGLLGQRIWYPSLGTGGVFYSHRFWAGYAFHHINQPNQSYFSNNGISKLPYKGLIQGGYKIPLKHVDKMAYLNHKAPDISISPTIHYKFQGKNDQLDGGLYASLDQIIAGIWYRGIPIKRYNSELHNNESLIFLLGWHFEEYSITYSYDAVISQLSGFAKGAHELNLTFIHLKSHKANKPMKKLPCPNFYRDPIKDGLILF